MGMNWDSMKSYPTTRKGRPLRENEADGYSRSGPVCTRGESHKTVLRNHKVCPVKDIARAKPLVGVLSVDEGEITIGWDTIGPWHKIRDTIIPSLVSSGARGNIVVEVVYFAVRPRIREPAGCKGE